MAQKYVFFCYSKINKEKITQNRKVHIFLWKQPASVQLVGPFVKL